MTDNIFICAFCKHISPTLNGFVKHIEKIHNIDYQIYFDTYIEPNDNHLCPVCLNKRKFFKGKYRKTCCNPECNYIQRKNTCIARYGVSNPSFIPEVVEKKKQTCLKHYGVEFPMQSNSILEKAKETNNKLYGVDWALSSKQYRNTFIIPGCISSFGEENPMNCPDIQNKCYLSDINNHNGIYHTQEKSWITKYCHGPNKKYLYNNINFKSLPELLLAQLLDEYNISYKYEPCQFTYFDKYNIKHIYTPDFLINNQLFEIKGDIFLDENNHLINFFNRDLDYIQEAKEQCIIKNNIILIKSTILLNLIKTKKILDYFGEGKNVK